MTLGFIPGHTSRATPDDMALPWWGRTVRHLRDLEMRPVTLVPMTSSKGLLRGVKAWHLSALWAGARDSVDHIV